MRIKPKQYAQAFFESLIKAPGQEKVIIASFASLLFKNGQSSSLAEILEYFDVLWQKHYGVVSAEIVSARPLSPEILSELKSFIVQRVKAEEVEVAEKIDKSLIGGTVLRYGGRLLDLSLRNKIDKLKNDLVG